MSLTSAKFLFASLLIAASVSHANADQANDEKMKKMALNAGCLTCHSIESGKGTPVAGTTKPVGPAWADVANKYRNKPGAADFLTRVVLEGSNPYSSHWKDKVSGIAMPPNAVAITEADTRQLVFWILSIK
ncbi:MAG TPA: c-type cytochrome [Azonexus sp.]|nr:c-type cytochrome [Azonexus sp.]